MPIKKEGDRTTTVSLHRVDQATTKTTRTNIVTSNENNQQIMCKEADFFSVFRHVPIAGFVYGAGRSYVKKRHGKHAEAKQSYHRDFSNLNPIRCFTNIVRDTVSLFADQSEGIWVGKKGLRNQPFGATLSPSIDFYHWAVMCNGLVYQLRRDRTNTKRTNVSVTNDPKIIESYHWYLYRKDEQACLRSSAELKQFLSGYDNIEFSSLAFFENKIKMSNPRSNCQCFILDFLSYATGAEKLQVHAELMVIMGTVVF